MNESENTPNRDGEQVSAAAAESAPVSYAGSPTGESNEKDRSRLSQAAENDPIGNSLRVMFAASEISGYSQAINDIRRLQEQNIPLRAATFMALLGAKMTGADRDARIKAAWEAA
jgi:hypothetical protein